MASTIIVDKIQKTGGVAFTLPAADGIAGQLLKTDGSLGLGWATDVDTGILEVSADTTPQLGGDLDCNGAQIQWSQGADVVSATALAVLTDGNYFDVTGTVTIATINTTGGIGTQIKLHFDGALTLTNSADIVLPTGANILTAAGDEAEFIEYASGDYRCTSYTRASGAALKIADESIDSDHYVDGSIDNAHLADDAVDSDELAAGSVDTAHIATNQIDETLLKDAFVADFTEVVVASGDSLLLGDATDGGNTKRDTVQGVLDLVHDATIGLQTIWVPANAMTPTDADGCESVTSVATAANKPDMISLDFKVAADSFAQFQIAFPKSWNEGTITYRVFWCSTATDTDAVNWQLEGVSVPDNSTINVAYGTDIHVTDNNQGATSEMLVSDPSAALTISNAAVDTVTFFRVGRDVSAGTAAEDARLLGVKLFFTTNAENDA